MRIYLPEKLIFTKAARVDKSLFLPILKSVTVLLYDFSTMNEYFYFQGLSNKFRQLLLKNFHVVFFISKCI